MSSKSEGEKSKIFIPKICEEGHLQHDCLTVVCEPQEKDVLKVSFTFDDRKISPEDVRWMSYHLQYLLSELNVKGEKLLRELDVCGTKEILQVQQWNSKPIVPCNKRVDEIFVERAHQWPLLTAINASDATLTYEEVDKLSSKISSRLRSLGVQKNDAIPLYMTKSAIMVVTMVALLKAGAAYVPLGTDLPQERVRLLLRDLGADTVICTPDQAPKLAGLSVKSLCYEIEGLWTDTAPDAQ
jgi:non-ribosomal peptide synthetase component F